MTLHIIELDTPISLIYQTEFIQDIVDVHLCQIKALRVQFVRGISEMNKLFIDNLRLWLIFCAKLKEFLICYEIRKIFMEYRIIMIFNCSVLHYIATDNCLTSFDKISRSFMKFLRLPLIPFLVHFKYVRDSCFSNTYD